MNFCPYCGAEVAEGAAFCPNCGAGQVRQYGAQEQPVYQQPAYQEPVYPQPVYQEPAYQTTVESTNTLTGAAKILSIISMVCGLVSLVSCMYGYIPGIAALVLASIASKKAPGVSDTKIRVGKITGIIGIILGAICFIAYLVYCFGVGYNIGSSQFYY